MIRARQLSPLQSFPAGGLPADQAGHVALPGGSRGAHGRRAHADVGVLRRDGDSGVAGPGPAHRQSLGRSDRVFLAFSSYYCLRYSDLVATEAWPDLFGVMLTFHGMVVFAQEGRFRQLLVKACLALLLGWHVLGLLLPFVVLGLAQALLIPPPPPPPPSAQRRGPFFPFWRLSRNRHLALGLAALCFAMAVLSFNLANEYVLLKGAKGLTELPSFQSLRYRAGLDEQFNAAHASALAWPGSWRRSSYTSAGCFSPPFCLAPGPMWRRGTGFCFGESSRFAPVCWGWRSRATRACGRPSRCSVSAGPCPCATASPFTNMRPCSTSAFR